jgi:hypothetical protein
LKLNKETTPSSIMDTTSQLTLSESFYIQVLNTNDSICIYKFFGYLIMNISTSISYLPMEC